LILTASKSDVSVFRPSNGVWYLLNSTTGFSATQFGIATDKLTPADFDGDGKTDIAVYRDGTWFLQRSRDGFTSAAFGSPTDVPMPADFDGDGRAELVVFRPSNGVWYSLNLVGNAFSAVQFGTAEDKPVAADFDGDNKADQAVYRPSNGVWYMLTRAEMVFQPFSLVIQQTNQWLEIMMEIARLTKRCIVHQMAHGIYWEVEKALGQFNLVLQQIFPHQRIMTEMVRLILQYSDSESGTGIK
jgi:hypothetical protein